MNIKRIKAGEYRVSSTSGEFLIRKLSGMVSDDFKWGVFSEGGLILEYGYTKEDCEHAISTWDDGKPVPTGESHSPSRGGVTLKREKNGRYLVESPIGQFYIARIPDSKRGDFQWEILDEEDQHIAGHFTKGDCESLIHEWIAHGVSPTPSPKKSGCLGLLIFLLIPCGVLFLTHHLST